MVVSVFWFLVGNRFWCNLLTYLKYNTVVALCLFFGSGITYILFMVHATKMAGMAGIAGMAGMAEWQKEWQNGRMDLTRVSDYMFQGVKKYARRYLYLTF